MRRSLKLPPTPVAKIIPLSKAKYMELQAELKRLLQERAETMQRLQTAREMGDLSENGAYKYAKFELGNIGRALRKVHHLLDNGVITEKQLNNGTVGFGCSVTLDTGKKHVTYTLVSEHESDPTQRKISLESPIGQALVGKREGDAIKVQAPAGVIEYTVLKVE